MWRFEVGNQESKEKPRYDREEEENGGRGRSKQPYASDLAQAQKREYIRCSSQRGNDISQYCTLMSSLSLRSAGL